MTFLFDLPPPQDPAEGAADHHPLSRADGPSFSAPQDLLAGAPVLDRLLRHFPAIDAQMEQVRECCETAVAQAVGGGSRLPLKGRCGSRNKVLPGNHVPAGSLQDSRILQEATASFVTTLRPFLQPVLRPAPPVLGSAARATARRGSLQQPSPALEPPPTAAQLELKRASLVSSVSSVGPEESESETETETGPATSLCRPYYPGDQPYYPGVQPHYPGDQPYYPGGPNSQCPVCPC